MRFFFSVFVFLFATLLHAQFEERYWILGNANDPMNTSNISFDFYPQNLSPYDLTNAPPEWAGPPNSIGSENGFEGWAVITDPVSGELILYTDGASVFDAAHNEITPTGGLGASPSSSQAVVTAVKPECPFDEYYIFSNPTGVSASETSIGPITYRTFNIQNGFSESMSLPGVTGSQDAGEGMVIIPSKTDPLTYWLVYRLTEQNGSSADYAVYRIDPDGVSFQEVYTFGPQIDDTPTSPIMNIAYVDPNDDPEEVIVGFTASRPSNLVFVNRFNTTTGTFADNADVLANFTTGILYDLEFSPDGEYVYYATYFPSSLYQVSVSGGGGILMRNFGQRRGGGLKRAPDGFIYHIYDGGNADFSLPVRIGRIIQPNSAYAPGNFNNVYQADFNNAISLIYPNVFAYNFPEFITLTIPEISLDAAGAILSCSNDSVQLVASLNSEYFSALSYQWLLDGEEIAVTQDSFIQIDQAGPYQVVVTLESGCLATSLVIEVVSEETPVVIDLIETDSTQCGESNGQIRIFASGGQGTLTYQITGTSTSSQNTFTGLPAGNYVVTVSDELGCSASQNTSIEQREAGPEILSLNISNPTCLNTDGEISIFTNADAQGLSYSIDGETFQTSSQFSDLGAGQYTVTVVDVNECLSDTTIRLMKIEDGPRLEAILPTASSCTGNDGTVTITATASDGALQYSLDNAAFVAGNVFANLTANDYQLTLRDERGCSLDTSFTIPLTDEVPIITALRNQRPVCGRENGSINVEAVTDKPELVYTLNQRLPRTTGSFDSLAMGTYTLALRDSSGCTIDTTVQLLEENCPVYVPTAFSPNFDGINDRFEVFSRRDSSLLLLEYNIFDRWGEHLYSATNFSLDDRSRFWDGTFRERRMPAGLYVYALRFRYDGDETTELSGEILLVR